MTQLEKDKLKKRCDDLITKTVSRKRRCFSSKAMYKVLQDEGSIKMAPLFKMVGYKQNRGYGLKTVFTKYLEFLINYS